MEFIAAVTDRRALGEPALGSRSRLDAAVAAAQISPPDGQRLIAAYETVSQLRLAHQCRRIESGERPDYRVRAAELDRADRIRLGRALQVIARAQQAMARRHQAEAFR